MLLPLTCGFNEKKMVGKMVGRVVANFSALLAIACATAGWPAICSSAEAARTTPHDVILRADHLLDVRAGEVRGASELRVRAGRIVEVGPHVSRPDGAEVIDLGNRTLMPGLIDAHVHLFLHPGSMVDQTIDESVATRVIEATEAARLDLMAGFTAERDMGTEGAGSASSAVRDAINSGLIPGPRMRVCANAISILGGHEDALGYNPDQHLLGNADQANTADALVQVIRQQRKEGADFTKVYETGPISLQNGRLVTPYQYTLVQLRAAVEEADRQGMGGAGKRVAVHAETEPGTGIAAEAGVASIDHAYDLSDHTMALMKAKRIFEVPTLTVLKMDLDEADNPERRKLIQTGFDIRIREFGRQIAAGVPFAVGSDVGPFAHGTQASELTLMVKYGMSPAEVLRADLLNGAELLGWANEIGELKSGMLADIIAVDGNPIEDISATRRVSFVMKNGNVYRRISGVD